MPTLTRAGHTLHYTDVGSGRPLVLIHSFLCSTAMWERVSLPGRRITVDLRGHGQSGPALTPFTLYDLVEDVLAVLDHAGVERATFVGLSIGGMVSMRTALTHPDRVDGLVLLDTDGGPESRMVSMKYAAMGAVAKRMGVKPLLGQVAALMFGTTTLKQRPELVAQWKTIWSQAHVPSVLTFLDALSERDDVLDQLGSLQHPRHVVVGAQDKALPPERSIKLAAALGVELIQVPDAGHLSVLERPALLQSEITGFLDRNPA
jgi:pimeloyl-ACP methyl ester carboxylesterase